MPAIALGGDELVGGFGPPRAGRVSLELLRRLKGAAFQDRRWTWPSTSSMISCGVEAPSNLPLSHVHHHGGETEKQDEGYGSQAAFISKQQDSASGHQAECGGFWDH